MCRRKNQQKNNGMWCKRNTHMHTISPIFYPFKTNTRITHDLNVFNKIIPIPTHEFTACLILTWFPRTSLIWSISELLPQLHTPFTYATTCSWVEVSCHNIFEKSTFISGAVLAFCHFRNHFLKSRSLSWIMRTCLVFIISSPYTDLLGHIIKHLFTAFIFEYLIFMRAPPFIAFLCFFIKLMCW